MEGMRYASHGNTVPAEGQQARFWPAPGCTATENITGTETRAPVLLNVSYCWEGASILWRVASGPWTGTTLSGFSRLKFKTVSEGSLICCPLVAA